MRPAWPTTWVLAAESRLSSMFAPSVRCSPVSNSRVRTQRLRYQLALPPSRRTPWTIPLPKNQWGETPDFGFGPLRT